MRCQVFPGCVPPTPPCGGYPAFQQTQAPLIATKRAHGGSHCPWEGVPESCAFPINIQPAFPARLGCCKLSVVPCYPRQRHGERWRGRPLLPQGPIRAVGAVSVGSRWRKAGEGAQGQVCGTEPSGGVGRGEWRVTLSFLTSSTCHLPAGSPMGLLGPCWVRWHCVQKSAPQVRQEVGVSPGLS